MSKSYQEMPLTLGFRNVNFEMNNQTIIQNSLNANLSWKYEREHIVLRIWITDKSSIKIVKTCPIAEDSFVCYLDHHSDSCCIEVVHDGSRVKLIITWQFCYLFAFDLGIKSMITLQEMAVFDSLCHGRYEESESGSKLLSQSIRSTNMGQDR